MSTLRNHGVRAALVGAALVAFASIPAVMARQAGDGAAALEGQILDVQRLAGQEGWLRSDRGLYWTRDAAQSWTEATPGGRSRPILDAFFLDASRGAAVWLDGSGALIFGATSDRGRSWREARVHQLGRTAGEEYSSAEVSFSDARQGWILARLSTSANFSAGRLFRTEDGGRTWSSPGAVPAAGKVLFADGSRGWIAGGPDQGSLYATTDGGRTWSEVSLEGVAKDARRFVDLPSFSTERDGVLPVAVYTGDQAELLVFRTADGGKSWAVGASLELPAGEGPQSIPAHFSAGRLVALGFGGALRVSSSPRAMADVSLQLEPRERVGALSFNAEGQGWAVAASGACDAQECRQTTRLLAVSGSGLTGHTLQARAVRTRVTPGRDGSGAGEVGIMAGAISTNRGFDKCEAPTASQMQTWWTYGPFRDMNVYYGGVARGCPNTGVTSSWVSQVFGQGWRLIPTWVGRQAPCWPYGGPATWMSSDPATARTQGVSDADAAVNAAAALGWGAGTPLYFNMEGYNETNASCRAAVRSFVDGWVAQVRARGYVAGVYGRSKNIGDDMTPSMIANAPDAIWAAQWVCASQTDEACYAGYTPSVWNVWPIPDSQWANNQRIHQYRGDHYETYGGIQFRIDSDIAQGPVAAPSGGTSCPYSSVQSRVQLPGQPWSQGLTITLGQSINVGSFSNGTNSLTTCCTSITITGPNGYSSNASNLQSINLPAAGTYSVRAACGGLSETATVTVNPAASCPYGSLQTRVQPNSSTPWSQALTITHGQTFTVGTFYNGTGQLTGCCTSISVTGPNGYTGSPSNLGVVNPPYPGTYTVRGTCGGLTETATVTVNPACPYESIQARVQPNSSTPWSQALTISQGQSFTVGSFKNGWGQLTDCCTTIRVTGPNGYQSTPSNLGTVTPTAAGTYSVTATCGFLTDTSTVTVASSTVSIALNNPGMETQSSAQYGFLTGWGPSGAWAFHSGFPRNGNAGLGTRFAYYSAGTSETVGQLLTTRFQANRLYTFRGYAQGGGDNTGVVPFQLGYAATDGVLSSFTPLATATYAVGADWLLRAGVSYRTPASGGPVGKQIIVRLGSGANGGQGDIWFDQFELFHAP